MSSNLIIANSNDLKEILSDISPLFPKGTKEIPIALRVKHNFLGVTCLSNCVYQSTMGISNKDNIEFDMTIMYRDITPIIPANDDVYIEYLPTGLYLYGNGFDTVLTVGYSSIDEQNIAGQNLVKLESDEYTKGLSILLNMGLEKYYYKTPPINVYKNVATLKYPNAWIQVKTTGLNFQAAIDQEHAKLLLKFIPSYCDSSVDNVLCFQNYRGFLTIPCTSNIEDNNFHAMMQDMSEPVTVSLTGYIDKVRNIAKLEPSSRCKLNIYKEGLKTTLVSGGISTSVSTGDIHSEVIKVCELPIQLWILFLKAVGTGMSQILLKGDILCLRSTQVIILTHVLV